jgi:hypothetical protein
VDEGLVGFILECVGTMSMNVCFITVLESVGTSINQEELAL